MVSNMRPAAMSTFCGIADRCFIFYLIVRACVRAYACMCAMRVCVRCVCVCDAWVCTELWTAIAEVAARICCAVPTTFRVSPSGTKYSAMALATLWTSVITPCCFVIGLVTILLFCVMLVRGVWRYFLRPGKNLRSLGSWAVVTGATDGIGRAWCDVLARKGTTALSVEYSCLYQAPGSIRSFFLSCQLRSGETALCL